VAIVTGANNPHGIGASIARALGARGARVLVHGFGTPGAAPDSPGGVPGERFYRYWSNRPIGEVATELRDEGCEVAEIETDLGISGAMERLFDVAEERLGVVEILVNNATYWRADTFVPPRHACPNDIVELWTDAPATIDASSIDRSFAVNVRAPALGIAELGRRIAARGDRWGRAICISTAGAFVFPSETSYGASKYAMESYARSAAVELARLGITVNTVSPGPIQTGWIGPEIAERIEDSIPAGRLGVPEDIADVVAFLASERARWVTGQTIFVGGGHGM
jgi:3-oxoacyl-[acyl-carrier protein] reductase